MDKKPDREEKVIRFGCGSIFGLLIGLGITSRLFRWFIRTYAWGLPIAVIIAIIIAITFGFMAVKQGDRLWEKIAEWIPPWWRH
jgi:uncharacterized protein YacL